ncbi:MAG TPA: glycine dehydrogenase subunit 2 [Methylothermaceae bacterium]|nr:glycine dehydrogenase subunit 2 [Methylothermaceae bacterium]
MLIFERSRPGRGSSAHRPADSPPPGDIPARLRRQERPRLPEVSELEAVRHYTRLSQQNFAIDTHFYPLGSCTMKYNPRVCHVLATQAGFLQLHPGTDARFIQGVLACLYELQQDLKAITGMAEISLVPAAGAQGEFAGVAMIRAYHQSRGEGHRDEILVPDAAHGTNPATASMCGFRVREIPTDRNGDLDLAALRQAVGPKTAGIMLTNPSTLGVFERRILEIEAIVRGAGGLLYYDGANLNAILGKVRPGDMGFDVIHLNLHKTFATPHGGGGPGAGPIGANERLAPFLPVPLVGQDDRGRYHWITEADRPRTIGRLLGFAGHVGVLLRAFVYIRLLGKEGLVRVAEHATLNANYLLLRLREAGFEPAYPNRRAIHEFLITLKALARETGVTTLDFAKRLLDYGFHAPTIYFPLLVPECMLIEPTETETKETLDAFAAAMAAIRREALSDPETVKAAPHRLPVGRLDEVRAARHPDLAWR